MSTFVTFAKKVSNSGKGWRQLKAGIYGSDKFLQGEKQVMCFSSCELSLF